MTKPPMRDRDDFGVALVTGAGSGIGQGIALRLAELGARVVVTDIAETGIADTVKQIEAAGGTALGQKLDVSDPASVNAAFDETERWDKCVDVLVNNAGIVGINPFLDFPLEDWNRVMAINLTGSMLCAQLAAREMVRQRYGRIINITSVSGIRAGVGRTAYGTSKAALVGLTRQIALEVAAHGVTANAIAPGAITTPLTESTYTEETVARLLPMIPAGYMADPADIAAAVAYLGSPDARYVNGETLVVDGGYVCGGMMQTGSLDLGTKSSS
ncbi:MAG: SDR family NAD(P)-dependent oxidoreductase [Sulfitobacter sp.]|jgi:NAD(P)-dependent dehydrogenase (short-subunit alcohol dehydrogenase family)|uniref:3-oxoacyl-[acyl-carrier-protein] reductase FabG n=7 Tax=root TaxID=1 RepID=A0A221KA81_9RHOB|nr:MULTISPECIES: SDR family NAD(P)-dependent oxidoreductase [Rhodobacterales]ASM75750.1 3-oxoacyl-[acyl-carrier-protein] reductase FabG [Pseudosulfitobacter pseudonitzschiae]MCZ4258759.1 SDR family NAD(P)-dependent oxidoreductase [Sulfitobacter sp. G21635-S1]MDR6267043.1 NAD(P)-dependent dehydrogenase (short-subunit alcohol dehydrogenase family) [Roseobacter sp. N2S]TDT72192.1 NAD(P)-dependent dehydrogenase (short-subunit alcohol dehydrogenase family) [Litoreibacter halocynthiae]UOA29723.1 3-o|tara:strand:- start:1994 stop:2809 length:816 start_codon:yes stop_codon:yes gene_type:complete